MQLSLPPLHESKIDSIAIAVSPNGRLHSVGCLTGDAGCARNLWALTDRRSGPAASPENLGSEVSGIPGHEAENQNVSAISTVNRALFPVHVKLEPGFDPWVTLTSGR